MCNFSVGVLDAHEAKRAAEPGRGKGRSLETQASQARRLRTRATQGPLGPNTHHFTPSLLKTWSESPGPSEGKYIALLRQPKTEATQRLSQTRRISTRATQRPL